MLYSISLTSWAFEQCLRSERVTVIWQNYSGKLPLKVLQGNPKKTFTSKEVDWNRKTALLRITNTDKEWDINLIVTFVCIWKGCATKKACPGLLSFCLTSRKGRINRERGKKVEWQLGLKKVPDGIMPHGVWFYHFWAGWDLHLMTKFMHYDTFTVIKLKKSIGYLKCVIAAIFSLYMCR